MVQSEIVGFLTLAVSDNPSLGTPPLGKCSPSSSLKAPAPDLKQQVSKKLERLKNEKRKRAVDRIPLAGENVVENIPLYGEQCHHH